MQFLNRGNVFLLEGGKLKKAENQYAGPYKVLEILGNGNIKISVKNKPKIGNINRHRLSYIIPPATNQKRKIKSNLFQITIKPKHLQRIDLIRDLTVREVNIKALWTYLFITGIFNYDDCNVLNWSQNITIP